MFENEELDYFIFKEHFFNNQHEIKEFKNDLISYIHHIENKLKNLLELKIEQINEKYNQLTEKNSVLSNLINKINYDESNTNKYEDYKKNTEYKLTSMNVKITTTKKLLMKQI